jgi:hypothetical protein
VVGVDFDMGISVLIRDPGVNDDRQFWTTLAGSGRVRRSTTASWFDQFDLAAASLQEFLEGLAA